MAGLGLIGSAAVGAAGGYFEGALKQIEEKRKEGFARLQAGLNQETNTLNNTQRNQYAIEQEKVRQANNLATTKFGADRNDARSKMNNSAELEKLKAEYKLRMKEKEFDRDNTTTKPIRDYTQEALVKAWSEENKARISAGGEAISFDQFEANNANQSALANSYLTKYKEAKSESERQRIIDMAAATLPQVASDIFRINAMALEDQSKIKLPAGSDNPKYSPVGLMLNDTWKSQLTGISDNLVKTR